MAEGFAKQSAGDKYQIHSAGSRPSGRIHPGAIEIMKEKGIDLTRQTSKGLNDLPQLQWDAIVTMGCGDACPHLPAKKRFDWNLADPNGTPVQEMRAMRDEIERRVRGLLRALEKSSPQ